MENVSSESDVVKKVLKYLGPLGLDYENISLEKKTVTIHAFRNTMIKVMGSPRNFSFGRIDILSRNDTGDHLFVIETKEPHEKIDSGKPQAISYARLLLAPFAIITNCTETKIYDSITEEELDDITKSTYIKNGFHYSITDDLRSHALHNFIGYSYENLIFFCQGQRKSAMEELSGSKEDKVKKYIPDLFVNRENVDRSLRNFIEGQDTCFLLHGKAGTGKTNIMCYMANEYGKEYPAIFINGILLTITIEESITQYFNFAFSSEKSYISLIKRLEDIYNTYERPFLIFIDAVDECTIPNFPKLLHNFIHDLKDRKGFKVVLSGKSYDITRKFFRINELPTLVSQSANVECHDFSDKEMSIALEKYGIMYDVTTNISPNIQSLCRSPFLMRIIFETNSEMSEFPEHVTSKEILDKFLEKKMENLDPESHDGCRLLLRTLISIMSEKDSIYADLHDVYSRCSIPSESLMYFLRKHYLVLDINGRVTFYFEQLRDYLYAIVLKNWEAMFQDIFLNDIQNSLTSNIGQNAVFWYRESCTEEQKLVIDNLFQTRANHLLRTYSDIIQKNYVQIKSLFDPHTDKEISLFAVVVGENMQNIHAFSFLPKREGERNINWKFCTLEELGRIHTFLPKQGATTVYYRHDLSNPSEVAEQLITKQLIEIIKRRGLHENTNTILIQEQLWVFIAKFHLQFGFGLMTRDFWKKICPLNVDKLVDYNVKYLKLWILHAFEQLKLHATFSSPQAMKSYLNLISMRELFSGQNHSFIQRKVEEDMAKPIELLNFRIIDPLGKISEEVSALTEGLEFLRRDIGQIDKPLFSFVDSDTGTAAINGGFILFSNERIRSYIKQFFKLLPQAYRSLVKANFLNPPNFILPILMNSVHIIIQFERKSGYISMSLFSFPSERDFVEVYDKSEGDILEDREGGFYIKTTKGEKRVDGYTIQSIDIIFGMTPIKDWCYGILLRRLDIRSIASGYEL